MEGKTESEIGMELQQNFKGWETQEDAGDKQQKTCTCQSLMYMLIPHSLQETAKGEQEEK